MSNQFSSLLFSKSRLAGKSSSPVAKMNPKLDHYFRATGNAEKPCLPFLTPENSAYGSANGPPCGPRHNEAAGRELSRCMIFVILATHTTLGALSLVYHLNVLSIPLAVLSVWLWSRAYKHGTRAANLYEKSSN